MSYKLLKLKNSLLGNLHNLLLHIQLNKISNHFLNIFLNILYKSMLRYIKGSLL
jgi:hypothetical protein